MAKENIDLSKESIEKIEKIDSNTFKGLINLEVLNLSNHNMKNRYSPVLYSMRKEEVCPG